MIAHEHLPSCYAAKCYFTLTYAREIQGVNRFPANRSYPDVAVERPLQPHRCAVLTAEKAPRRVFALPVAAAETERYQQR
jgi:hypothetical protein